MNITNTLSKIGKYYLAAAMLLISFSCNRTDIEKSEQPLLSKAQVEEILLEIYVIEGKARVLIYKEHVDKVRMLLNYEMKSLFERYNTNYKQFFDSYSYYMANASVSKKMMSDITNRLIVLEAEQIEKNKLVDSLKNIKLIDSLTVE